ncbi:hypothetical protein BDV26DRAFT_267809 [Aspergillus bertholletiae]|uniref:Uncharacterized protein n=1 Tax=Aspergillus bertholletiae TaxID=1226010 RepID=A0A5N7B283_9EURO|nr:hypothetical protein BDV26DRAFT_267809 [Aspergillus bertholletiae]
MMADVCCPRQAITYLYTATLGIRIFGSRSRSFFKTGACFTLFGGISGTFVPMIGQRGSPNSGLCMSFVPSPRIRNYGGCDTAQGVMQTDMREGAKNSPYEAELV